jgi:hypothetical protein
MDFATQNQVAKTCGVGGFRYYTPSSNQEWDGAPNSFHLKFDEPDALKKQVCVKSGIKNLGIDPRRIEVHVDWKG